MKRVLQRIDMIYILGFLVILTGVYFNDVIWLSNHPLYTISTLFTPLIVQVFIWGGVLVIIVELILTKDILKFKQALNLEIGGAVLYTVLSIVLVQNIPSNVGVFLSLFLVLGFILIFLVLHSHYGYLVSLITVGVYSIELFDQFRLVSFANVLYMIGVMASLLVFLYLIIRIIIQVIKKQRVMSYVVYLGILVTILSVGYVHDNMYRTIYKSSSGITQSVISFCTPVEEIEEELFLGVSSNDTMRFSCEAIGYGVATHTERFTWYSYVLFLPLPILSYLAYHYGKDLELIPGKKKVEERLINEGDVE